MRKWITLLMTLLVGCGSYANGCGNSSQVFFEAGYRRDTINWRHRFPSNDPVATSSTRFKDLDIFQIGLHGRATLGCNFYARANAYWGWILDGDFENKAHTYFSADNMNGNDNFCDDNFRFGFSDERRSTIDDKYVFGIGAAIGYPFYFCDCTFMLAPVIGYAFDEQNIEVDQRRLEVDNYIFPNDNDDREDCCERKFASRWYGPFVGVDFDYRPWNSCVSVWGEIEYHWGSFRGRRSQCDGFPFDDRNRRSRDATAWVFALGFDYDVCDCWTIGLSAKFQDWSANRHHRFRDREVDSYLFGSCEGERVRTNHKWRSYAINLTIGREF